MKDLIIGIHHRGKYLVLRTIAPPVELSAIVTVVEDETGEVDRLTIYNFDAGTSLDEQLPKGSYVAVKEPYFRTSNDRHCTIRVDHPSDLVVLYATDDIVSAAFQPQPVELNVDPKKLKEAGNAALDEKHYHTAADLYTQGLDAIGDGDMSSIKRDLYRNRAGANLKLRKYNAARDDAYESMAYSEEGKEIQLNLKVKAWYRAAHASYELQDYACCSKDLHHALSLNPADEAAKQELQRTVRRLEEQDTGNYDFEAMAGSVLNGKLRNDIASFLGRTAIRPSKYGRGLFATQDIKAGELVMVEKGFAYSYETDDKTKKAVIVNPTTGRYCEGTHATLMVSSIQQLSRNHINRTSELLDLHTGTYKKTNTKGAVFERNPAVEVVDVFLVQAIIEHNACRCPTGASLQRGEEQEATQANEEEHQPTGIWVRAQYINHSCVFNASRSYIGDAMIVRANKDIRKDGEITVAYFELGVDLAARRARSEATWSFKCSCALCTADAKTRPVHMRRRIGLCAEVEDFVTTNRFTRDFRPEPALIRRAITLLAFLAATYDDTLYKQLPRLGLADLQAWLVMAYVLTDQPRLCAQHCHGMLSAMGYTLTISQQDVTLARGPNAVPCDNSVEAVMFLASIRLQAGEKRVARKLSLLAKGLYETIKGSSWGFEESYPLERG